MYTRPGYFKSEKQLCIRTFSLSSSFVARDLRRHLALICTEGSHSDRHTDI